VTAQNSCGSQSIARFAARKCRIPPAIQPIQILPRFDLTMARVPQLEVNYDRLFWAVLFALIVSHWVSSYDSATTVTAYYGATPSDDAHMMIYGADVATQTV